MRIRSMTTMKLNLLPAVQGRGISLALIVFACAMFSQQQAKAQSLDPFLRPPPSQQQAPITPQAPRPPFSPQQNTPPQGVLPNLPGFSAAPAANNMENLAKQGFEVKGLVRASERALDFMVIMQRGGEVRTCLLRVSREGSARPKQESVCF